LNDFISKNPKSNQTIALSIQSNIQTMFSVRLQNVLELLTPEGRFRKCDEVALGGRSVYQGQLWKIDECKSDIRNTKVTAMSRRLRIQRVQNAMHTMNNAIQQKEEVLHHLQAISYSAITGYNNFISDYPAIMSLHPEVPVSSLLLNTIHCSHRQIHM